MLLFVSEWEKRRIKFCVSCLLSHVSKMRRDEKTKWKFNKVGICSFLQKKLEIWLVRIHRNTLINIDYVGFVFRMRMFMRVFLSSLLVLIVSYLPMCIRDISHIIILMAYWKTRRISHEIKVWSIQKHLSRWKYFVFILWNDNFQIYLSRCTK